AEAPDRHDAGEKTLLGRTGKWAGADLLKILVDEPATAGRVAAKLCRLFFGENAVAPAAVRELADGLREHDLEVGWAAGVLRRSRLFFAAAHLGRRVLGRVEFVVGAARALELFDPAPSTLALADWSARMGQDLFDPPNVGGWPGGRAWVHTRGLVARSNYAAALVAGRNVGRPSPHQPAALPRKYGFGTDAGSVLTFHHRLLFGTDPGADVRRRAPGGDGGQAVAMLLSSPEAQLG